MIRLHVYPRNLWISLRNTSRENWNLIELLSFAGLLKH